MQFRIAYMRVATVVSSFDKTLALRSLYAEFEHSAPEHCIQFQAL